METTRSIVTCADLRTRLHGLFGEDKPILVETGDGIFRVVGGEETPHEFVLFLGPMP